MIGVVCLHSVFKADFQSGGLEVRMDRSRVSPCSELGAVLFSVSAVAWILKLTLSERYLKRRMVALLPGLYTIGNQLQRHNIGVKKLPTAIQADRQSFFRNLADRLELTQRTKFIHVAGTKGKGSTCEYIAAGLRECGATVGVFTSPHIHTARERIKIGKRLIPIADFMRLAKLARNELRDKPWVVFFDLFLCIALHHFGENHVDYVVLETGIGGLYDSTNFVISPCVTVITNIGLDHQNILGDTIEEIAHQKAGIIKQGVPIFTTAKQRHSVMDILTSVALSKSAPLSVVPATAVVGDDISVVRSGYTVQQENSLLAFAVLKYLGVVVSDEVKSFYWPCRMELFSIPMRRRQTEMIPFVVDGNHNGESTRLFIEGLRREYPDHRVVIVFGSGADKCMDAMAEEVMSGADIVIPVQASHFKSTAINRIIDMLIAKSEGSGKAKIIGLSVELNNKYKTKSHKVNGGIADNLQWLIDRISHKDGEFKDNTNTVIGTCGSLFVACETREFLFEILPEFFAENDWVRDSDAL